MTEESVGSGIRLRQILSALRAWLRRRQRPTRRYDVFLSYSHCLDRRLAPAIQHGLQQLGKPWSRRRVLRVFRDATDLGASPALWPSIRSALVRSKNFVLLASPEAAASKWVQREIKLWLRLNGTRRLYVVITSGEDPVWGHEAQHPGTGNPIPTALASISENEPLWVDFREVRNDVDLRRDNAPLRDALAHLAAPIRGLTPSELIGEDYREFRRTIRTAWGAAIALATLLALALTDSYLAEVARRDALHQARVAQSRQLAAVAETKRKDALDSALLLSAEAFDIEPTEEARDSILGTLEYSPHLSRFLYAPARFAGYSAISPDGQTVVSGGSDRRISFWNRITGKLIRVTAIGHSAPVRRLVFSPDSKLVASGDASGHIFIWNAETGAASATSIQHGPGGITGLSFTSDARTLVSTSLGDREVRFWDANTGQLSGDPLRTPDLDLESVSIRPGGRTLATINGSGLIRLWDTGNLHRGSRLLRVIRHPVSAGSDKEQGAISTIAVRIGGGIQGDVVFSPDGKLLASRMGASKEILFWNPDGGTRTATLAGVATWGAVAFSGDGKRIAAGSVDGSVMVWDVETKHALVRPMPAHRGAVASLSFDQHGDSLVSTSADDARIALWDIGRPNHLAETLRAQERVDGILFLPGTESLISAGSNPGLVVWDLRNGKRQPRVIPESGGDGRTIAVTTDKEGRRMASATENEITAWDPSTWKPLWHVTPARKTSSLAMAPDGKTLAVGLWSSSVELRSMDAGDPVRVFTGPNSYALTVAFNPTGSVLAAGWGRSGLEHSPQERSVVLWDIRSGQSAGRLLLGHSGPVMGLAFSRNGRLLASGSGDKTVRLWDVEHGAAFGQPLSGQSAAVCCVARTGGSELVSGSWDGSIRLWSTDTYRPIGVPLIGHQQSVTSVAATADGKWAASASSDGTVSLWPLEVGKWQRLARDIANRPINEAERRDYLAGTH